MKFLVASMAFFFFMAFAGCSKDNETCYECLQPSGAYTSVGCFTKDEWAKYSFTDAAGNTWPDKNLKCRKK